MPIHSCTLPDGSSGYRWGSEGKCYRDRKDAEKQAQAAYANGYAGDADTISIAMDKSVRRIDQDGHLHVELSNISKANVCPYYGWEIPDFEKLGLNRDQIYQIYRHPNSLQKAADSFNGKQLLIIHKPQSAEEHGYQITVGAVYNVEFNAPYLQAELVIWPKDAIDLVESQEQRELSCGYWYKAVKEPGVASDGTPYDLWMDDIKGNHVALVFQGRAGSDVFVGDAMPTLDLSPANTTEESPKPQEQQMAVRHANLSKQALLASGALRVYLRPKLAADAKIDLTSILQPVTAKNWDEQKPKIKVALDSALAGKLAKDADINDIVSVLQDLDHVGKLGMDEKDDDDDDEDDDEEEKKRKAKKAAENLKEAAAEDEKDDDDDPKLKPNMPKANDEKDDDDDDKKSASDESDDDDDDDKKSASDESDDDDDDDKKARDRKGARDRRGAKDRKGAKDRAKGMDEQPMITKAAMDAAIAASVAKATKDAEAATMARLNAIHEAREDVRPIVGAINGAMDSAASVYKVGLEGLAAQGYAVDMANLKPDAYGMVFKALKPAAAVAMDAKTAPRTTRVALDSAAVSRRNEMFPNANRLLRN